ncbi:protein of unknown function DUF1457 [Parvibaculum lavamentivorans DS-1]|uniref:PAS domain-containing protein n=1 Tax=Parvibaculum lavamentivorans (strain DS-1 / DSM 13023 / NCIMB 13966) TaxID=402881 RepID=A7HP93_PARL1|nr:PAS domain-containing protein [Parvibaculum lavamentivorans]ABS61726.1 protein of unknown function DUF1457 [Parvibaculum lavamentivorans DS-1]
MSEPLRLAPFDIYIDPLLSFQDSRLREMLAYWETKRAGRPMPARADVSPAEIISHLPSVFLVDAAPPALSLAHFRVRLMGTALNELFANDYTGRTLEQEMSEKSAAAVAKVFGIVCQLRRPLRLHGQAVFAQAGPATALEAVLMPLTTGVGSVDMVMGELVKRASA